MDKGVYIAKKPLSVGNYIPSNKTSNNYLLQKQQQSTAAYSLRKLNKLSTFCARVRRSSDSAERNIGFVNNIIDIESIMSFVGSGSGYIATWYDQSGNGYHSTQSSAVSQPAIVLSGVLITTNNKPSIRFDGVNDFLSNTTNIINGTNPSINIFSVSNKSANSALSNEFMTQIGIGSVATSSFYLPHRAVGATNQTQFRASGGTNSRTHTASDYVNGTTYLLSSIDDGSNVLLYRNGSTILASSATSLGVFNPGASVGYRIGHITGSTVSYWRGELSEMIIYNSIQSVNKVFIENNINSYYGIY